MINQLNIGLEIHIRINSEKKFFSPAINSFSSTPNVYFDIRDLGFPGMMPLINKEVLDKAILFAKCFDCEIASCITFDRKNYFYSDLPKGYQITQKVNPLAINGIIAVGYENIKIKEIHLEEDTCKQIHKDNFSFLDFNRCGVPLVEIVFEPEFHNEKSVIFALKKIIKIAKCCGFSDCKMEDGSLRVDVNVSNCDAKNNSYIEIKNLNSFEDISKSIDIVSNDNSYFYKSNVTTYRFNESSYALEEMREKNISYRYCLEPNIPVIYLSKNYIDSIKASSFASDQCNNSSELFEFLSINFNENISSYWCYKFLPSFLSKEQIMNLLSITKRSDIIELVNLVKSKNIESSTAKKYLLLMLNEHKELKNILITNQNVALTESEVIKIIDKQLDLKPELIREYSNGKTHIINYLMSVVMKEIKGKFNPSLLKILIEKELRK